VYLDDTALKRSWVGDARWRSHAPCAKLRRQRTRVVSLFPKLAATPHRRGQVLVLDPEKTTK
jgi:hypothetical protein